MGNFHSFDQSIDGLPDELLNLIQGILNNTFTSLFGNPAKSSPLIFLFVFSFCTSIFSQEKIGLATSNYGGVYAQQMNPAASLGSKIFLDFNFIGADVFVENNFLFIHKEDYNLFDYLSKTPTWPVSDVPGSGLDYTISDEPVQAFQQLEVMGPSISYSLGQHNFGVFSKATQMLSVNDLPRDIAVLMYEGLGYDTLWGEDFSHGAFDFSTIGWWEIGGNYSYMFKEKQRNLFSAGINLRMMFGYAGVSTNVNNVDYTLYSEDSLMIGNLDATIGFSAPVDFETNDFPAGGATFKGKGFGVDLGFVYSRKKELSSRSAPKRSCALEPKDYFFKIGLSVLDIGQISFDENAQQHSYENVSANLGQLDTLTPGNISDFTAMFSNFFYGDPTASLQSNSFELATPTRISIQADYQYFPNWYLNAVLVMPVKIFKNQLRKPSQAIVSLRYETARWEVNMPLSLYDFRKPRVGLYARFYFFSVGTDNLGGLFSFKDFTGLDLYVAAKFHIAKGKCSTYKPSSDCRHLSF